MSGSIDFGTVAWFPQSAYGTVRLGDREVPRCVNVEIGDPLSGSPLVRMRLEVIGDRPQCREVSFASVHDGRELRQGDFKAFQIADWIERVYALAAWPGYGNSAEWQADEPQLRKAVTTARQPGSRKVNRAFLEEVADVYRRNINDRPTRTVAVAFGIAHSTAAEYVRRARAEALLPPTTSGKRRA